MTMHVYIGMVANSRHEDPLVVLQQISPQELVAKFAAQIDSMKDSEVR